MESTEDLRLPVGAVLVDSNRLHRGSVTIARGRISGYCDPASDARDWFAIPGLRNAHVHLDLSAVPSVPRAESGFARWVLALLERRGPFDVHALQRGAALGARACLANGTTSVADIDSSGAAAAAVAASGLKGIAFREILGSTPPTAVAESVRSWIREFPSFAPGRMRPGISPHAPYSTPVGLYAVAAQLAQAGLPYTTHIAETLAEGEYLRTLGGEFAHLFEVLKLNGPLAAPVPDTPLEYLERQGGLGRHHLLAHANYPSPEDLDRLAASGAIVAFCPRSHAFFGHRRHPVATYLERGIRVALGTDSLASNGTLSMFDEMAFLAVCRPDLGARRIFEMATGVAAPLLDGGNGTLDVGAPADLVVVASRNGVPETVEEALTAVVSGALEIVATVIDGSVVWNAPGRGWDPVP